MNPNSRNKDLNLKQTAKELFDTILFILNSQSTSFLYAGYEAVKKGYDPKSQNGIYCKPENYTISEVYESFSAICIIQMMPSFVLAVLL